MSARLHKVQRTRASERVVEGEDGGRILTIFWGRSRLPYFTTYGVGLQNEARDRC